MSKTKVPWADYVWNPVSGCLNGCKRCTAKKQLLRFSGDVRLHLADAKLYKDTEIRVLDAPFPADKAGHYIDFPYGMVPTFHRYRINSLSKLKRGENVLVCNMGDLFGDWIPDEIIEAVFAACQKYQQHNYLFLTKNPTRYGILAEKGKLPQLPNMWYGVRVLEPEDCYFHSENYNTFVLISTKENVGEMFLCSPLPLQDWVIIDTGVNRADEIAQYCNTNGVPVYMTGTEVRQMPEQLTSHPHVKHPLYDGRCSFCKEEMPKKEMVSLLYREGRGASAYALGFACPECFRELKKKMDADEPVKEYEHEKPCRPE